MPDQIIPEPICFTIVGQGRVSVARFPIVIAISIDALKTVDQRIIQRIELDTAIRVRAINGWARYSIVSYDDTLRSFTAVCSAFHLHYIPSRMMS